MHIDSVCVCVSVRGGDGTELLEGTLVTHTENPMWKSRFEWSKLHVNGKCNFKSYTLQICWNKVAIVYKWKENKISTGNLQRHA